MAAVTKEQRLVFPGLGGLYEALHPWGYTLIRFGAGAILIYHGYMKLFGGMAARVGAGLLGPMGFPAPVAWGYFLGALEFFGCMALAVGLFTRPIALALAIEMAIVTFAVHWKNGYFFSAAGGGFEFPLLLLVLYLGILFHGPGRYSLDRMMGREL
ncbi:MAG TPA: DoxX family protein [Stellaceae bacterium]|nr:DoxX family protein [Stellaceae bacterium]